MRIHVVAVGHRAPAWVQQGWEHFTQRLPTPVRPKLHRIAPGRRVGDRDSARRARDAEGQRILKQLPDPAHVVALEIEGSPWSSAELSARLAHWQQAGRDVYLLIGGPDGLAPACLGRANERWSLSPLTLPHALVQVLLAEALYRAWSIGAGHPYHRG